jgi:cellulose synthase/poly-beta-1,6-N-acetylglucosamine synthase-like glycosyltransferase
MQWMYVIASFKGAKQIIMKVWLLTFFNCRFPLFSLYAYKISFRRSLVLFIAILNQQLCCVCRFYFQKKILMVIGNEN